MKTIYIYTNNSEFSIETKDELRSLLPEYGFAEVSEYNDDVDLIACIGGDGTFLNFCHECYFPAAPIIGINTGHLGFFQEAHPDDLRRFLDIFMNKQYTLQSINYIEATVRTENESHRHFGINEILVRGPHTHLTHLNVDIDNTVIQEFCGDGIMVSTTMGSTAYNYSLGGAIIAPELDNVLQMTPIAPSNTNANRCFHSSIIYPSEKKLILSPIGTSVNDMFHVAYDGLSATYSDVKSIEIVQSSFHVNLIRYSNYSYWTKLKDKLL